MKLTASFYVRLAGSLLLAYLAWQFGTQSSFVPPTVQQSWGRMLLTLSGAGLGFVLTPYLVLYPFQAVMRAARTMPPLDLAATGIGLVLGLVVGLLLTFPLSYLPGLLGDILPFVASLLSAYIGAAVITWRKNELLDLVRRRKPGPETTPAPPRRFLVDTSVIIDGRIAEVARSGFFDSQLVVPTFVLQELQQLADSGDELTRTKGKRGLEVLRVLGESELPVEFGDHEVPNVREVDDKLVVLAKAEGMRLLTNDSNLHRVAELQRVEVLNLNNLAEALRVPFSPGEQLRITIRQEGREREQGVGFMQDGTMVVVEDARHQLGSDVLVTVTRVYQTGTGRIIFAQLASPNGRGHK
jgi:uncharacterized protein YacL